MFDLVDSVNLSCEVDVVTQISCAIILCDERRAMLLEDNSFFPLYKYSTLSLLELRYR